MRVPAVLEGTSREVRVHEVTKPAVPPQQAAIRSAGGAGIIEGHTEAAAQD